MGSREREQTAPTIKHHQPHLSSLVVRLPESGTGGGSDYEPGEVRRDPPIYSRSDRFPDSPGSGSPLRYRKLDHHYGSDFDHSGGSQHGRGFRGARGGGRFRGSSPPYGRGRGGGRFRDFSPPYGRGRGGGRFRDSSAPYGRGRGDGRFRDSSPPYGRGRGGSRSFGRGFDEPGFGSEPFRDEESIRNNPNVSPREGDWICPEPSCGNVNFAWREYCNNCDKLRFGPGSSPRRNYPGSSPQRAPLPRFSSPPMDRSPGRGMNGYRSPPRGWVGDAPREFRGGRAYARHGGRFLDHHMRRGRPDYREEEDSRERARFDRPMPPGSFHRDHGRDNFNDRREYDGRSERRPPLPLLPSSPPPSHQSRWGRDERESSRSPIRGGPPPPKEYRRDVYMGRGRGDRRGMASGSRFDEPY